MIEAKDFNTKLWAEAIKYFVYIRNRSPHKYLDGKKTYESLFGHKPSVSHFMVFGAKDWVRIPLEKQKSLHPQREDSIMVGYYEYEKRYKLFYPSS